MSGVRQHETPETGEANSTNTVEIRVQVERGMMLLHRDEPSEGMERPVRYRLWTVASVRKTAKGSALRLLGWSPGCLMEATATFPEGFVPESWQVFSFSQPDLEFVWAKRNDV